MFPAAARAARALQRGFTLPELMIVITIVGVLTLLAYPTFTDSIRKSRRAEAMSALAAVQQAQERWRSNNAAYTLSLADLNLSDVTPSGRYAVSIAAAPASAPLSTSYVATAVGKDGTSQAADAQCRKLSVQLSGGTLSYAGCGACADFVYTATHLCWAR